MKISQIASLGLLTLAGAVALPAAAAAPPAGAQPPKPANNLLGHDIVVSSAKAPAKPAGTGQITTQSGSSSNAKSSPPGTTQNATPHTTAPFMKLGDIKGEDKARDPASGQATSIKAARDVASGQSSGIVSPNDPSSGLPAAK